MVSWHIAYGAMRCAVLTESMVLCNVRYWPRVWCYAMCGTDLVYGATPAVGDARKVRGTTAPTSYRPTHLLCHVRYGPTISRYRPELSSRLWYGMFCTDLAYHADHCARCCPPVLTRMYGATEFLVLSPGRRYGLVCTEAGMRLQDELRRLRLAMEREKKDFQQRQYCASVYLRACYAMSGTDIRACNALSGTERAYGGDTGDAAHRSQRGQGHLDPRP
eukprot:2670955-Rhodomonas_salina.2